MDHNAHRGSYGVLVIQSPTSASIQQDFLAGSTATTPTTPTNPELTHATAAELTKINEQEVKFKGHVYKVQVPKVSSVRSKYVSNHFFFLFRIVCLLIYKALDQYKQICFINIESTE